MSDYRLLINGALVEGDQSMDVINPATVWINKHAELDPAIPFGGVKQSGIGSELGQEGLQEFTQLKVINMAKG